MSYKVYRHDHSFTLESGAVLPGYHLAYTTHGELNEAKDNVVWIFHALTANSDPAEWWPGLVGKHQLFDPAQHYIVCVNMPGSCYGSAGPLELNPVTAQPYYHAFPFFTTRDMIRAYQPLKNVLGIQKIHIGIGGSMGGQQLLEWAIEEPLLFDYIFPIATNAQHSAWGIAFNTSQRLSIEADESWTNNHPEAGLKGMLAARSIALLSYRHYDTYQDKQSDEDIQKLQNFKSDSYQRYQGEKLVRRFNAFSYYKLGQSMDAHHVGRGRNGIVDALARIQAKTLVIGINTDILFPLAEQQLLAAHIKDAQYKSIHSPYGHDGFLLEFGPITTLIREFIAKHTKNNTRSNADAYQNV